MAMLLCRVLLRIAQLPAAMCQSLMTISNSTNDDSDTSHFMLGDICIRQM